MFFFQGLLTLADRSKDAVRIKVFPLTCQRAQLSDKSEQALTTSQKLNRLNVCYFVRLHRVPEDFYKHTTSLKSFKLFPHSPQPEPKAKQSSIFLFIHAFSHSRIHAFSHSPSPHYHPNKIGRASCRERV